MKAAYKHWLDAGPDEHDPRAAAATTVGPAIGARRAAICTKHDVQHTTPSPSPPSYAMPSAASPSTTAYSMRPSASPLWSPRAALFEALSADSTGGPGTMRTAEPSFDVDAARFIGATIRLFDAEVLVIRVVSRVLGDRAEAPVLVAAFGARFRRTIVLVAQDRRGIPTYFGPGPIAAVLARMPFDALPWRRYRYRPPRPQMLPIPVEPLPSYSTDYGDPRDDNSEHGVSAMRDDGPGRDDGPSSPDAVDRTVPGHRKRDAKEVARRTRTLPPG